MSRVIKTEVCLWLVNWQRNSIIWWAFVHLDLVSSCKGAKCSDKLSIDGFWRSGLFLLLYMEKTWEVLGASFLFFFFNPFQQDVSRSEPGNYPLQLVRQSSRNFFGLEVRRGPCLCCTGTQQGRTTLFLSATWIRAKEEQTVTMSCSNQLPSSINCQPWFYV